MTDREKLLALLAEFGLRPLDDGQTVTLEAEEGGVKGYPGFFCDFNFDKAGKFVNVGVWE